MYKVLGPIITFLLLPQHTQKEYLKSKSLYNVIHRFGQAKFDFKLEPIIATVPAASKSDAWYENRQK